MQNTWHEPGWIFGWRSRERKSRADQHIKTLLLPFLEIYIMMMMPEYYHLHQGALKLRWVILVFLNVQENAEPRWVDIGSSFLPFNGKYQNFFLRADIGIFATKMRYFKISTEKCSLYKPGWVNRWRHLFCHWQDFGLRTQEFRFFAMQMPHFKISAT